MIIPKLEVMFKNWIPNTGYIEWIPNTKQTLEDHAKPVVSSERRYTTHLDLTKLARPSNVSYEWICFVAHKLKLPSASLVDLV